MKLRTALKLFVKSTNALVLFALLLASISGSSIANRISAAPATITEDPCPYPYIQTSPTVCSKYSHEQEKITLYTSSSPTGHWPAIFRKSNNFNFLLVLDVNNAVQNAVYKVNANNMPTKIYSLAPRGDGNNTSAIDVNPYNDTIYELTRNSYLGKNQDLIKIDANGNAEVIADVSNDSNLVSNLALGRISGTSEDDVYIMMYDKIVLVDSSTATSSVIYNRPNASTHIASAGVDNSDNLLVIAHSASESKIMKISPTGAVVNEFVFGAAGVYSGTSLFFLSDDRALATMSIGDGTDWTNLLFDFELNLLREYKIRDEVYDITAQNELLTGNEAMMGNYNEDHQVSLIKSDSVREIFQKDDYGSYPVDSVKEGDLITYSSIGLTHIKEYPYSVTLSFVSLAPVNTISLAEMSNRAPLYRFWSDKFSSHFYTISEPERKYVDNDNPDWQLERIAYYVGKKTGEGCADPAASNVHRFWSDSYKKHFYTTDEAEKNSLIATNPNWTYEGAWFCANISQSGSLQPVYRFWSDVYRGHFFTIDEWEKNNLIDNNPNWKFEGVAFYALKG